MSENIKTRKYYRVHNGTDWDRMHFVTDANSVDANDGDNMETKVGAIKGITTSTEVTEEGYAADATTVAALNSSLGNINIYVGDDKKLHFVDKDGADSVLPFSSISNFTLVLNCTGYSQRKSPSHTWYNVNFNITITYTNGNFSCTAPGLVGGGDEEKSKGINVYITSVTVSSFQLG